GPPHDRRHHLPTLGRHLCKATAVARIRVKWSYYQIAFSSHCGNLKAALIPNLQEYEEYTVKQQLFQDS
ncbi:hypothetical protein ACLOJK_031120, partial [Asimina triloba]